MADDILKQFNARFRQRMAANPKGSPSRIFQSMAMNPSSPFYKQYQSLSLKDRNTLIGGINGGFDRAMADARKVNPKATNVELFSSLTGANSIWRDYMRGMSKAERDSFINQYRHGGKPKDNTFLGIDGGDRKSYTMHNKVDKLGAFYEIMRRDGGNTPQIAARRMVQAYRPLWDTLSEEEKALFQRKYVLSDKRGDVNKQSLINKVYSPVTNAGTRALLGMDHARRNAANYTSGRFISNLGGFIDNVGYSGSLAMVNAAAGAHNALVDLPVIGNRLVGLPLNWMAGKTDPNSIIGKTLRGAAAVNNAPAQFMDKFRVNQQFDDEIAGGNKSLEGVASFARNTGMYTLGELAMFGKGFGKVPGVLTTGAKVLRHPIKTVRTVSNAAAHPMTTATNAVRQGFNAATTNTTGVTAADQVWGATKGLVKLPVTIPKGIITGVKRTNKLLRRPITRTRAILRAGGGKNAPTTANTAMGAGVLNAGLNSVSALPEKPAAPEIQWILSREAEGVLPVTPLDELLALQNKQAPQEPAPTQDQETLPPSTTKPKAKSGFFTFDTSDPTSWGLRGGGAALGAGLGALIAAASGGKGIVNWLAPVVGAAGGYALGSTMDMQSNKQVG